MPAAFLRLATDGGVVSFPHREIPHRPVLHPKRSLTQALLRRAWTTVCNVGLIVIAALMFKQNEPALTWLDAAFAAAVVVSIMARKLELAHFDGGRVDRTGGAAGDLQKYAFGTTIISFLLWMAIRAQPFLEN
jgi:hypothetical protein